MASIKNTNLFLPTGIGDIIADALRKGEEVVLIIGSRKLQIIKADNLAWGDNNGGYSCEVKET